MLNFSQLSFYVASLLHFAQHHNEKKRKNPYDCTGLSGSGGYIKTQINSR